MNSTFSCDEQGSIIYLIGDLTEKDRPLLEEFCKSNCEIDYYVDGKFLTGNFKVWLEVSEQYYQKRRLSYFPSDLAVFVEFQQRTVTSVFIREQDVNRTLERIFGG